RAHQPAGQRTFRGSAPPVQRLVGTDADVGVDRAVELLDPLEVGLDGFPRAELAGANPGRNPRAAHLCVPGGIRCSISTSRGRTISRKPSTPARSSSSGKTP